MFSISYRLPMPRSFSTLAAPSSVRFAVWVFSSQTKSPVVYFRSPSRSSSPRSSLGMIRLTRVYFSVDCSEGPEMISGVLASSIRIESTSSTIAKWWPR